MTELINRSGLPFAKHYRHAANLYQAVINDIEWHRQAWKASNIRNKELARDNANLEKNLLSLLSRPEVQAIIEKDKRDEEDWINNLMKHWPETKEKLDMTSKIPTENSATQEPGS